ncbi:alpha/beta hydrolase-fold protein [Bacteroidota bacterium]
MNQRDCKIMRKVCFYLIIPLFLFLNKVGYTQDEDKIVIGNKVSMHSNIFDREIEFSIHVPENYDKSNKRYPVLYTCLTQFEMVSGIVKNLYELYLIPETIVINIDSYEYGYLTPTTVERNSNWGKADLFLQFFKDELFPIIDSTYRTHPYRIIFSGAIGGVFTIYSIIAEPDIFNAGIAPIPWIIYDRENKYLINNTESFLNKNEYHNFLYIAMDNEFEVLQDLETFVNVLRKFPKQGLEWKYYFWPEEDHYSTGPRSIHSGLRSLFKDWNTIPVEIAHQGLDEIKKLEDTLNKKFGYDIGTSLNALWWAGQDHLKNNQFDKAIDIFKYRVEKQTDNALVYVDLGIAYERDNQLQLAKETYEKAYDIEESSPDPLVRHIERIKNFLDNINKKINETKK